MNLLEITEPSISYTFFIVYNMLHSIKVAKGLPPYDCTQPLNQSDCGLEPTPVFSYYKSGSRCEIEYWRGCPTFNKFEDQIECVHHCIFRMLNHYDSASDVEAITGNVETITESSTTETFKGDRCSETLSLDDCQETPKEVYTFNSTFTLCEKVLWRGCSGHNIFPDLNSCQSACAPTPLKLKWEAKLDDMPDELLEDTAQFLDSFEDDGDIKSKEILG